MYCSNLFKVILFPLLFIQLNGAVRGTSVTRNKLLKEYNISSSTFEHDDELQDLIYSAIEWSQTQGSGYEGVIKDIKSAVDFPANYRHKVARKYFGKLAVVDTSKLSPKEKLRAELKQKFGIDCPKRAEEWEGYKTLVEKYNAKLKANQIDLVFTQETLAHVCHSSLTDNSKLVGNHFCCFSCWGCGRAGIAKGSGGQNLEEISYCEAPDCSTIKKYETTIFKPGRKVEDVLEKITETLIANNPKFITWEGNKIDIQTSDGEYITVLLQEDDKTVVSFYPSMKNFDKKTLDHRRRFFRECNH